MMAGSPSPRPPRRPPISRSGSWTGWSGWPRRSASTRGALLDADPAHRARHHRRDQCAARAQGRQGRPAHDRRPPRRPRDARGAEGRPLRPAPAAARAARAPRPALRGPRADPRRRAHRDAARRGLADRRDRRARAERGRGRRGLLPARLARSRARGAHRRRAARGAARRLRLAVRRGAAPDQGVRAGLHDGRERLCRAGARALSRPARGAPAGRGVRRADPDRPVPRRPRDDRRFGPARGRRGAVRPCGRRRRQPPWRAPDRAAAT